MTKIEKLTAAQKARFPEFVDKWTRIGLCTDPADRARAEEGIRLVYAQAKLPAPRIVWCTSPLAMGLTRAIVEKIAKDPKQFLGDSLRASVRASVWDSVGSMPSQSGYGQHDASGLGFYDFFTSVLGLTAQTAPLVGLTEVSLSAGWFLPQSHICWISERHCVARHDERRRIHCENGPAIQYPDGWALYAWHGTRVPQEWINDRASLTPQAALTWKNVEQRRAACEILGWPKILSALNAVPIDRDGDPEIGELVEVEIPEIGRERFLRVRCGTGREFALPVPPNMRTALEANAWGFDIPANLLKQKEFRT